MIVNVRLIADDGAVIAEHSWDALSAGGWEAGPAHKAAPGGKDLAGFTYLPFPPPRGAGGVADFRLALCHALGISHTSHTDTIV